MRKNVLILSRKSLRTSYSCILYLKQELEKYANVILWSHTPRNDINVRYKENSHSFYLCWYGKIRIVRVIMAKIQSFFMALRSGQLVIIHDLDFFIPVYFAKKLKSSIKVVHYNTEIHGSDVYYPRYLTKFYEKHADFPDIIIECLAERAYYRKQKFGIKKRIYIINNTLPFCEIQKIKESAKTKVSENDVNLAFSEKLPVVMYAGGCNSASTLTEIIETFDTLKGKCNFLFFLDDNGTFYDKIKLSVLPFGEMCHVCPAVDRGTLFQYMEYCDIGINYYDPHISINHMYAAPSKVFEYMALGLKIVSTNNKGIDKILSKNKVGKCFLSKENIALTIDELVSECSTESKRRISKVFKEKYCYEKNSKQAIDEILKIIH